MAGQVGKPQGDEASVIISAAPIVDDVENGSPSSRILAVGNLGLAFHRAQVCGRGLSIPFGLGALAFIAYLYHDWKPEPTTSVDVLFPSFFPLVAGIMADTYEVVYLFFLGRRRSISPMAVCFDVLLVGSGIFCFMVLGITDKGAGERRARWAADMIKATVVMMIFSFVHAAFIVLAAAGMIRIYHSTTSTLGDSQTAGNQPGRQARGDPVHDCSAHGRITIRSVLDPAACCRDPACSFRPPSGQESPTLLQFLAQAAETFSGLPGFTNPWIRSDEDILLCSALNLMSDLNSARAWLAAQGGYGAATGVQLPPSHYHDHYNANESAIVNTNQADYGNTTNMNDNPLYDHQPQTDPPQASQTAWPQNYQQHQQQHHQEQQQEQQQEQAAQPTRKSSRAWTAEEIQALRENMNNPEWTYARMSEQDPRLRNRTAHAIESKVYALKGKRKALREARKAAGTAQKQQRSGGGSGGGSGSGSGSVSCRPPAAEEHPRRREPDNDGDDGDDGEGEGEGEGEGNGSDPSAGSGLAGQLLA
ncbi:hypothetical protein VTG60DRAFT_4427 [Thermothelomyces hinnuleus]